MMFVDGVSYVKIFYTICGFELMSDYGREFKRGREDEIRKEENMKKETWMNGLY